MRFARAIRTVVVGVVVVVGAAACEPPAPPVPTPPRQDAAPWYCAPTAFNSVTGIGMGTTNFYAGRFRKSLIGDQCVALGDAVAQAKAYAEQYPTTADAEAGGFRQAFQFYPGMGTHHGLGMLTPEVINAPGFNANDPILPGTATFDPNRPNYLQYDSESDDGRLVGMSWYLRSTTGKPPEGFAGKVDWWHHHPRLCLDKQTAEITGVGTDIATCNRYGGVGVNMERYYMLHLWVVEDIEYHADVFAPTHPCVGYPTTFDMDDPCHDTPNRPTPRAAAPTVPGTKTPLGYCPLGRATA
jgi:hypothetical protein